jgi:hypothetical protein
MIETIEIDKNLLERKFYDETFYFSYSGLNTLLESPGKFYNDYVLKNREEQVGKHLLEGTLIHYLVLDGLDFDSKFMVAPESLPSESSMSIINEVYKQHVNNKGSDNLSLVDYGETILDVLKEKDLHQRLKEDTKRIEKVADSKGQDYFLFLKTKGKRTIIDGAILDKCSRRADTIKADGSVRALLGLDLDNDGSKYGTYNELELKMEPEEYPFGFRGIIDNLVVDVEKNTVTINDFKTTGKSLKDFTDSVEYWNYWLQAAMYDKLVRDFLKGFINDETYISFNFIVFDKYDQLYSFPVTGITLADWKERCSHTLMKANYHYVEKEFKLPYAFAKGNIKL